MLVSAVAQMGQHWSIINVTVTSKCVHGPLCTLISYACDIGMYQSCGAMRKRDAEHVAPHKHAVFLMLSGSHTYHLVVRSTLVCVTLVCRRTAQQHQALQPVALDAQHQQQTPGMAQSLSQQVQGML